jgi:hypothetical protein
MGIVNPNQYDDGLRISSNLNFYSNNLNFDIQFGKLQTNQLGVNSIAASVNKNYTQAENDLIFSKFKTLAGSNGFDSTVNLPGLIHSDYLVANKYFIASTISANNIITNDGSGIKGIKSSNITDDKDVFYSDSKVKNFLETTNQFKYTFTTIPDVYVTKSAILPSVAADLKYSFLRCRLRIPSFQNLAIGGNVVSTYILINLRNTYTYVIDIPNEAFSTNTNVFYRMSAKISYDSKTRTLKLLNINLQSISVDATGKFSMANNALGVGNTLYYLTDFELIP